MVTQTNPKSVEAIDSNSTIFQRIINTLLLNVSFINNIGLMHGKMGISIFFFHLARRTKNKIYEDYAGELIDEIYEEISANTPVDFENGLAGIGWGIEYLVQNGFIEADTNEVLEEFDNKVFNEFIYNIPKELNLLNGILGYGVYFLNRVKNRAYDEKNIAVLTNRQTLIYLVDELDKRTQNITEIIQEPIFIFLEGENARNTVSIKSPLGVKTTKYLKNNKQPDSQPPEPSNAQALETSDYQPQPSNKKTFDLLWDYPVLLWFLCEIYQENIFNSRVEEIIQRLTEPLTNETNLPKLQSNRLLLALALINVQHTINLEYGITNDSQTVVQQSSNRKTDELSTLQTIINNLLYGINRNTLKSELPSNNDTIRYGISGIRWMYKQLYKLTKESNFKNEFEYWINQNSLMEDSIAEEIRNMDSWGLLEGYSGYLFIQLRND